MDAEASAPIWFAYRVSVGPSCSASFAALLAAKSAPIRAMFWRLIQPR